MQFPIVKKEDKSLALEVPDDLLQQLTSKLSPQADAQLQESQGKVTELEEKLATAESRTMDDFSSVEKANFVMAWGKGLSLENKAIFATAVGIPLAKATEAEVAEAEAKSKVEEAEGLPAYIEGKTDKPGYKYHEYLNLSVREEEEAGHDE